MLQAFIHSQGTSHRGSRLSQMTGEGKSILAFRLLNDPIMKLLNRTTAADDPPLLLLLLLLLLSTFNDYYHYYYYYYYYYFWTPARSWPERSRASMSPSRRTWVRQRRTYKPSEKRWSPPVQRQFTLYHEHEQRRHDLIDG